MYCSLDRSNINMFHILQCVFLIAFFASTQAQVPLSKCPDVEVVNDFDASKYVGRWYEYECYPTVFEVNAKCVTATYTAMSDGSIGVFNEQINDQTGEYHSINGTATFEDSTNVGKLSVEFPVASDSKGTYWVLGTDYTNFSVVWSCNEIAGLNIAMSWVLTREAVPTKETLAKARAVIEKNQVPKKFYFRTEQEDCNNRKH